MNENSFGPRLDVTADGFQWDRLWVQDKPSVSAAPSHRATVRGRSVGAAQRDWTGMNLVIISIRKRFYSENQVHLPELLDTRQNPRLGHVILFKKPWLQAKLAEELLLKWKGPKMRLRKSLQRDGKRNLHWKDNMSSYKQYLFPCRSMKSLLDLAKRLGLGGVGGLHPLQVDFCIWSLSLAVAGEFVRSIFGSTVWKHTLGWYYSVFLLRTSVHFLSLIDFLKALEAPLFSFRHMNILLPESLDSHYYSPSIVWTWSFFFRPCFLLFYFVFVGLFTHVSVYFPHFNKRLKHTSPRWKLTALNPAVTSCDFISWRKKTVFVPRVCEMIILNEAGSSGNTLRSLNYRENRTLDSQRRKQLVRGSLMFYGL